MAIEYHEFLQMQDSKKFDEAMRELMRRLRAFRERRIAEGYPFDGRLASTYEQFMSDGELLAGAADPENRAQTENALRNMDSLGALLNLRIIPGNLTLRSCLSKKDDEADREKMDDSLETISGKLGVRIDPEAEPIFDYRRMNGRSKVVRERDFKAVLNPAASLENRNTDLKDGLRRIAAAFDEILREKVDQIETEDPKIEEKAQELLEWKATINAVLSESPTTETVRLRINGVQKELTAQITPAEASVKLRTKLEDFLVKKLPLGNSTKRVEDWITDGNEQLKKDVRTLRDALDPETLAMRKNNVRSARADQKLDQLLEPFRRGEAEFKLENLCEIFGARIAAGADRNDLSGLKATRVTDSAVEFCKNELMKSDLMKRFYEQNAGTLAALAAKKRSHGGVLEDKFRKFLKKLPPQELKNTPILQRYMPSYGERIEALQTMAAEAGSNEDALKAMAEIVVLRGMAQAERKTGRYLDLDIQCDKTESLGESAKILYQKKDFQNAAMRARDYVKKGHGGKMLDVIREQRERGKAKVKPDRNTGRWLDKTTYKGALHTVQVQAALMLDKLQNGEAPDMDMKEAYRELCLKTFGLREGLYQEDRKPGDNVSWTTVLQKMDLLRKDPLLSTANLSQVTAEDMQTGLSIILDPKAANLNFSKAMPLRVNRAGEIRHESLAELNGPAVNNQ